ncbi:hypothetical protein B0J14DRAFT_18539 [Halenospora varia]|nr:hypothetical protein B0J14DRAFT_18539 [Halenospora varia]
MASEARKGASSAACDRCHRQKLRCIREMDGRGACERCVKASVDCTTMERKRTGRPAKKKDATKTNSLHHQSAESQTKTNTYDDATAKEAQTRKILPEEVGSDTIHVPVAPMSFGGMDWFNNFDTGDAQYMESFDEMDFSSFSFMDNLVPIQGDAMEVPVAANAANVADSSGVTESTSAYTSPNEQVPKESFFDLWRDSPLDNDACSSTTHVSSITTLPSNGTFLPRTEWFALNAKCTTKLTKLISDLFHDMETISSGEIRAILSTLLAPPAQTLRFRNTSVVIDRTEKYHYPIAEILLSCKRLVEILRVIEFLYPTGSEGEEGFKSNQRQFRPSSPKIELPTLLALFTAYSALVQSSELVVNAVRLSLIEHIKSPKTTGQTWDYRQMEVGMLCRVLWRMLTHNESRIRALKGRKIDGLTGDGEVLFDSTMPSLGRRDDENDRSGYEGTVGRGIERIARVLYGRDIRMM